VNGVFHLIASIAMCFQKAAHKKNMAGLDIISPAEASARQLSDAVQLSKPNM
jgi:hypothetical protein